MDKENGNGSCCRQEETHCPVEATIGLIGGKYKSLILWKLAGGTLRFSQLKREVSCATPKMLISDRASARYSRPCTTGEAVIWPGRGWPRIAA